MFLNENLIIKFFNSSIYRGSNIMINVCNFQSSGVSNFKLENYEVLILTQSLEGFFLCFVNFYYKNL
jgi:hypothetical protein